MYLWDISDQLQVHLLSPRKNRGSYNNICLLEPQIKLQKCTPKFLTNLEALY